MAARKLKHRKSRVKKSLPIYWEIVRGKLVRVRRPAGWWGGIPNNFLTNRSGLSGVCGRKMVFVAALLLRWAQLCGDESERAMSPVMLMALFILGCDLLLYAFFAWTYPDRSGKSRRATSRARQSRLEHVRHS